MTQETTRELEIAKYVEIVNGKIAGIRLALVLLVANTQIKENNPLYIKALEYAEERIKEGIESGEFKFDSEGYPEGTLSELRNLIESLSDLEKKEDE